MYEITFIDTGRTVAMAHWEAEDYFGKDELVEILAGNLPHIVAVKL